MKYFLFATLILLPLVAMTACGDDDDDDDTTNTPAQTSAAATSTGTAFETIPATTAGTATAVPTTADVCPENTDPADATIGVIDAPQPSDASISPLTVSGQYTAFEAQFNISILDADGTAIVDNVPAMSSEGQTMAPFEVAVPFEVTEDTPACLQVYDISNADGVTKTNIIQVPVTLLP